MAHPERLLFRDREGPESGLHFVQARYLLFRSLVQLQTYGPEMSPQLISP